MPGDAPAFTGLMRHSRDDEPANPLRVEPSPLIRRGSRRPLGSIRVERHADRRAVTLQQVVPGQV